MDYILETQQTPHSSPSRVSYGVSIVRIWEKIDRVITMLHCIPEKLGQYHLLLMPWFLASLGHQQPWYKKCCVHGPFSSTMK